MPSTIFNTPVSRAAYTLALLSLFAPSASAESLNAMTYVGCYSSSAPLTDEGSYQYQTSGYCQPICVGKNQAVLGLSGGSDCWCGDLIPATSSKVDDSKCSTPCNGFGSEHCGGNNFWSVYLSGTEANVANYGGSSSSSASSAQSSASPTSAGSSSSPATTAAPSSADTNTQPTVVTSVAPGTTVVITQPAAQATTGSSSPSPSAQASSGGGTNVAGIAAGVVVGVVGAIAIAAGIFFFLRHRRRQQAEEEYKRSQVSDFMRGGERKPPNTGYSNMSDQRLDPEAGRRNSVGSIADNEDYSRRVLRVANPDSS